MLLLKLLSTTNSKNNVFYENSNTYFFLKKFDQNKYINFFFFKGGVKKRKKKNYTKPKKQKHAIKKTKLRYLRYFDIIENSIKKLRKNSPECSGCFMAEHKNRLSCGKTGLSFTRI